MAVNTSEARAEDTGVPALRATGMRKRFGGIEVLHGVDLEMRPGDVHALWGKWRGQEHHYQYAFRPTVTGCRAGGTERRAGGIPKIRFGSTGWHFDDCAGT